MNTSGHPNSSSGNYLQNIVQGVDKWPFGESSLTEFIILQQEQERTKQEQIKLQNLEKSIQLLKSSIEANIPRDAIPKLFTADKVPQVSLTSPQPGPRPQHIPQISKGHQRSSTISSTKELYNKMSPINTKFGPQGVTSPRQPGDNTLLNQYITHTSPFKFPTKIHSTAIPESQPMSFANTQRPSPITSPSALNSPKSKKVPSPGDMSSFQHVIQFHHWQLEDPAAMIRKELLKGSQPQNGNTTEPLGHSRRKSNPEVGISRSNSASKVTKPPSNPVTTTAKPSFVNKAKSRVFNHSRTKSENIISNLITINDFSKFKVGKENILNDTNVKRDFNPLNSLASAAVMHHKQLLKDLK